MSYKLDTLPPELARARDIIRQRAVDFGLDFFEVIFEMVDFHQMNEFAAYMGFPTRYPHWRWGMEYERLRRSYTYGLHKIYEMVINTDPCYAYLLESNELVDQKLVISHVFGHSDMFKNNLWFAPTNKKMMDEMANHATRVRRWVDRVGMEEVEQFIDVCLSLENLIDRHALYHPRLDESTPPTADDDDERSDSTDTRLPVERAYMERFINPPEGARSNEPMRPRSQTATVELERDVLGFLLHYAPLQKWQQDILEIVRAEAYYFSPQGATKIMNEGWSVFVHTHLMTEAGIMDSAEVVDYADHHAGTVAMSPYNINPYKIGLELFLDIEERWNKGQFGPEWDDCDDARARRRWDKQLGLGRAKVFEVRKVYNDVGFIDTFFTEEFCNRHNLFTYHYNPRTRRYEISSRDFAAVKQNLLFSLTNFGQPVISVVDANYENRGTLLLRHHYEGVELKLDEARETLQNLHVLWTRPVAIQTVIDDMPHLLTFDGQIHRPRRI